MNSKIAQLDGANCNAVLPITYNNSTYFPVRAVSNILDVAVHYDAEAHEAILGERLEGIPVKLHMVAKIMVKYYLVIQVPI